VKETTVSQSSRSTGNTPVLGLVLALAAGLIVAACQAAAPPTPEPSPVVTSLAIHADTVQGPANLTDDERAAGAVCVQKNRFARNEEVVWRVRVTDPLTSEPMDDQALSVVIVKLPDQELAMRWGPHPRDNPVEFFWTVAWDVPEDYPSGQLPFTVEATATDGRTGAFEQFGVAPARLAITEEIRPIISE
jgi:hypothetical protein